MFDLHVQVSTGGFILTNETLGSVLFWIKACQICFRSTHYKFYNSIDTKFGFRSRPTGQYIYNLLVVIDR